MGKRRRTNFDESAFLNNQAYGIYLNRLTELAISRFKWNELPETVDARYMELQLFMTGSALYFRDDVIGDLCLNNLANGNFGMYGEPNRRRAYSVYNNYQKAVDNTNSVIIWNNMLRTPSYYDMEQFAKRLYNIDRTIDVNCNAQKTPILIQCSEKQRLSLLNTYKEYDGNSPVLFADNNLDITGFKVLTTGAPYVADKLYQLKTEIWNEALTYLGISNVAVQKKSRLITDEVTRMQGGTVASRYPGLESRREAAEKINAMFGTNISVDYREDLVPEGDADPQIGGDYNE